MEGGQGLGKHTFARIGQICRVRTLLVMALLVMKQGTFTGIYLRLLKYMADVLYKGPEGNSVSAQLVKHYSSPPIIKPLGMVAY